MKKLPALLLFSVYLLTQAASPCWYIVRQLSHQFFAVIQLAAVPQDELLQLTVGKEKLKQLQNEEGEIILNGIQYDIEHTVINGDNHVLYLKQDIKETQWNKHYTALSKLLHRHTNPKDKDHLKTRGIFFAFFYEAKTSKDFTVDFKNKRKNATYAVNNYPFVF